MPKKRVLYIESGQFLGGVISSLFSDQDQISLIEASPANGAEMIQAIQENDVQIVVIDDTLNKKYLDLLLRYMRKSSGLRVIVIGADSNHIEVYQKQHVPVQRTADFFAVL